MSSSDLDLVKKERFWRLLTWTLLLGTAAFRLVYLFCFCTLDLSPDEAQYWNWSRHLDWSYYSKGPAVAYLIRSGCWLAGDWSEHLIGSQMAAVRLPAIVCGFLLLLSLYLLTVQIYRKEFLGFVLVAVASTLPLISAGSILMTIDAPYTCCWGWALLLAYLALFQQKGWAWPLLGLVLGLGILAKYTMILFFPSLGLFLLLTPRFRHFLKQPGPWLATGLAGLCCLPILIWNMNHDWVSFLHLRGHAGMASERPSLHWFGPLDFAGAQFALLLGFWFVLWAWALWDRAPWKSGEDSQRFLWWLSAPMFLFFFLFGFTTGGGQPNWPVTAYLSGMVLVIGWLEQRLRDGNSLHRRILISGTVATCLLGLILTMILHRTEAAYPLLTSLAGPPTPQRPYPMRRLDPTCRLRGWQKLAEMVDEEIARLQSQGIQPILAASDWNVPGELAFYCKNNPKAYSLGLAFGGRYSQYDLWRPNPVHDPQNFQGRTFIFVGDPKPLLQMGAFQELKSTRLLNYQEQGQPIGCWQISVLHQFRGLPHDARTGKKY